MSKMRCPNGHALQRNESLRLWWPCGVPGCDFPDAKPITDQYAAANRLGPYAPNRETFERIDMPGYVQTGPASYEHIGPGPDFRAVWQAGLRAVRSLRKKGEW